MFTSVYNILIVDSYFCNEVKALMQAIMHSIPNYETPK